MHDQCALFGPLNPHTSGPHHLIMGGSSRAAFDKAEDGPNRGGIGRILLFKGHQTLRQLLHFALLLLQARLSFVQTLGCLRHGLRAPCLPPYIDRHLLPCLGQLAVRAFYLAFGLIQRL